MVVDGIECRTKVPIGYGLIMLTVFVNGTQMEIGWKCNFCGNCLSLEFEVLFQFFDLFQEVEPIYMPITLFS